MFLNYIMVSLSTEAKMIDDDDVITLYLVFYWFILPFANTVFTVHY